MNNVTFFFVFIFLFFFFLSPIQADGDSLGASLSNGVEGEVADGEGGGGEPDPRDIIVIMGRKENCEAAKKALQVRRVWLVGGACMCGETRGI